VKCAGDSNLRCLPDNRARSLPFPESIRRSADIIAVIYPGEDAREWPPFYRSSIGTVARLTGQFSSSAYVIPDDDTVRFSDKNINSAFPLEAEAFYRTIVTNLPRRPFIFTPRRGRRYVCFCERF